MYGSMSDLSDKPSLIKSVQFSLPNSYHTDAIDSYNINVSGNSENELEVESFEISGANIGVSNPSSIKYQKGRLLFVGDIHGCLDEFLELMKKVGYRKGQDTLVLLGDLVGKGPSPHGVIRAAKDLGAIGVRGNHDDLVIRWFVFLHQNERTRVCLDDQDKLGEVLSDIKHSLPYHDFKIKKEHVQIARKMTKEEFEYLSNLPAMIHFKGNNTSLIAVHAGLDPRKKLSDQDSAVVMRMRNILENGEPDEKRKSGSAWFEIYNTISSNPTSSLSGESHLKSDISKNDNENKISATSSSNLIMNSDGLASYPIVFYGHDAKRGLQLHENTVGLDSGCVYGRKLSVYIYPQNEVVQVDCPGYAPVE
ncbi:Bis(5'-nucleosyl)-tetraphosphatase, symmetrical [Smittium culicis]|uniref:Bis(5'-nucleosyl)-tetraphosphatase, symmetrical n=1 Tax=Smittium culicis TaxID=133412 RepID=A0A1R1X8C0_9FUNG|nr:Bis(5'-nucleosyl)-tetraphosphatase, symmetrical [Smittium culicis]OMJ10884.1 Bis(5'-nucleosyl)-tetraphosphatase, symmetrical [Smittium culicis]